MTILRPATPNCFRTEGVAVLFGASVEKQRGESDSMAALRWAAFLGIGAAVVGALTLAGYSDHMSVWQPPVSGAVVASVTSQALLVGVEVLLCLAFVAIAALGVATHDPARARVYAFVGVVCKPLLSVGVIGSHWDPGWYYILDPNGTHKMSLLLLVVAGAQVVAFAVAIRMLGKSALG